MQAFSQFDFSSFQMTPVCVKLKKMKQNKRPAQAIYLRPHYIVQISLNLIWPGTDLDAPQLCVTSLLSHVPQEQLLRATGSEDSEFHRKTGKSSQVRSTESTKAFTQSTWPCKRQIGVCYVWPQWQDLLIFWRKSRNVLTFLFYHSCQNVSWNKTSDGWATDSLVLCGTKMSSGYNLICFKLKGFGYFYNKILVIW